MLSKDPVTCTAEQQLAWDQRDRRPLKEHIAAIRSCHRETDHWAMGAACRNAVDQLDPADLKVLRDGLPFSDGNFLKYVKIGRTPHLYSPSIRPRLPTGLFLLYHIALLTDDELSSGVKDGIISPSMERPAFVEWRRQIRGEERPAKKRLIDLFIDASLAEQLEIVDLIDKRRAAGGTGIPVIAEEVLHAVLH